MRIVRPGASEAGGYIAEGWANAARALGWSFLIWDGQGDVDAVFEEFRPDVYIADVRFRHRVPGRVRRGETRVAMAVDQWADPIAFPALARNGYRTKRSHIRWVRRLNPQILFHHSTPGGIERGWWQWRTAEGREVISLPSAGDTQVFRDEGTAADLACDIGYVGGYWPYKAPGLHEYLLDHVHDFHTSIVGRGWPHGVATAERISQERLNRFTKSATVMPCIHEPHSRLYGVEIVERIYKVPLAGGFTITDPVGGIYEEGFFTEDEVPMARNGTEMRALLEHFTRRPEERLPFIRGARERVLRQHTYFHRLAQLVSALGFGDAARHVQERAATLGVSVSL